MLLFKRKIGECVQIGDIKVQVRQIGDGKVKLAIEVPRHLAIKLTEASGNIQTDSPNQPQR